jgi:hypothetical protein
MIGAYEYRIFAVGSLGAGTPNGDVSNVQASMSNGTATVTWANPTYSNPKNYSIIIHVIINGQPLPPTHTISNHSITSISVPNVPAGATVSFNLQTQVANGFFYVTTAPVQASVTNPLPCFPEGTRLLTAEGYKLVEDIEQGELVVTSDGRCVPVTKRSSKLTTTTNATAPYTIPKSSLAPNVPSHTVRLSPNHAIQLRKGLWMLPFAAAKLGNTKVVQETIGEPVTYYHFECPNYFTDNLVIEGGVVVESFGNKNIKKFPYTYNPSLKGFTRAAQATRISK